VAHSHEHTTQKGHGEAFVIGVDLNITFVAIRLFFCLLANQSWARLLRKIYEIAFYAPLEHPRLFTTQTRIGASIGPKNEAYAEQIYHPKNGGVAPSGGLCEQVSTNTQEYPRTTYVRRTRIIMRQCALLTIPVRGLH